MKTDIFTKFVLSIIAVALVVIAANMTMPAAASREVLAVNILQVSDKWIGRAIPVQIQP